MLLRYFFFYSVILFLANSGYITRRDGLKDRLANIQSRQGLLKDKFKNIQEYLDALDAEGRISDFHEVLWLNTVNRAIVQHDGTIILEFK